MALSKAEAYIPEGDEIKLETINDSLVIISDGIVHPVVQTTVNFTPVIAIRGRYGIRAYPIGLLGEEEKTLVGEHTAHALRRINIRRTSYTE